MKSGIYKITNLINDDFYIGSSVNVKQRFTRHRYQLNKNISGCKKLQAAWNKYGKDNFKFEIIEFCVKESCKSIEQLYLDSMKPKYNICRNAQSPRLGMKASEETISKMRESHSKSMKSVIQYDLDNKLIKIWGSLSECSQGLRLNESLISQCCKGKRSKTGGFKFQYKDDLNPFITIRKQKKYKNKILHTYQITTPDKQIMIVSNLREFCRDNNLNRDSLISAHKANRVYKGYFYTKTQEEINNGKANPST